ncbi:MAG: isopentenyl phosphate kinase [Poseidonia sp.]
MRERVVVKWGGGLITHKDRMKSVRHDIIDNLANQLESCVAAGLDVVLVHGAGSFGHLKAKAYRLAEGRCSPDAVPDEMTQDDAVVAVREDMMELNQHVLDALTKYDVSAVSLSPHQWARNVGPDFQGDLSMFAAAPRGIVMVTHGDVVDCDGQAEFGILSGDDLVYRLASELPGVKRLVFAMGGVEGVLASPPTGEHDEGLLLPTLSKDDAFEGEHAAHMDVTGGIGLKVARGFDAANHGVEVHLVSGELECRVRDACLGEPVRGTILVP